MSSKTPYTKNTYVIPKYGGFIPGNKGNSELGRCYTKISRRCLVKEDDFQKTKERFRSSNFMTENKTFDKTRPSFYRGYGCETLLPPHEAIHEQWSTTMRKTYLDPKERSKPNTKQRLPVGKLEFDNTLKQGYRPSSKASGFQANAQLFDETSWATEKNVHTDQYRTEYRNRFNQPKPFHKRALVESNGRLRQKGLVYDNKDFAGRVVADGVKKAEYIINA